VRVRGGAGLSSVASQAALAALILWPCCVARGQAAAAQGYRIAGQVVDAESGEPVPRVTVSVLNEEDYHLMTSAVTDGEGHFAFEHLPAGKYPLTAAKRGFRTSYYDEHDDFNSAIVTGDGLETGHLVFRIEPGAVLRGVVTGDGGDAVENAQVMLFRKPSTGAPGGRMEQAGNTETDDTGAYEFAGLPPGEYLLAVKGEPWFAQHGVRMAEAGPVASPLDVAYPVTYYDSVTEEGAATPIPLTAGSREEADISLHGVPALRFTIAIAPGRRHEMPRVTLQQRVFGNAVSSETMEVGRQGNGKLDVAGIAPGNYELEFGDPPRTMTVNAASNLELDADAGTPALSVTGTLKMAGGGPVPADVSLTLSSADEQQAGIEAIARRGQFEFTAVRPGTWSLSAGGGSTGLALAVVATAVGGAAAAGDQIVVRDRPVTAVVTLSRAQVRVKGFARKDGKAAAGVMILLAPREPGAYPALARRDQSDSDGSFELRDVPAGQYTAIAIEDGWKLDWQRREVIAPYLRGGVAVKVTEQSGPVVSVPQAVPVAGR